MPRKTSDPKLIALRDKLTREQGRYERWFSRMTRAVNALVKHKRRIVRLTRLVHASEG
jgi:hypothetical protein